MSIDKETVFKVKNFTSSMPVINIIARIEELLSKIGATHIEKFYESGVPIGIVFSINHMGKPLSFKIPANIKTAGKLLKEIPLYRKKGQAFLEAQSARTAWKLVYNWVEIQINMIKLEQAEALQVFMPYIYDKALNKTLYQHLSENNFKMIGEGK